MDHRVQHVASFVRANFDKKLTLKELADLVTLSPWWLCHLFQANLNTSPTRFLAQVRLEKATDLLADESLSIKEIGHKVGFSNLGQFHREFKANYGVSPATYRNGQAKNESKGGGKKEAEKEKAHRAHSL